MRQLRTGPAKNTKTIEIAVPLETLGLDVCQPRTIGLLFVNDELQEAAPDTG